MSSNALDEAIAWRLRFLYRVVECLPHMDEPLNEDECYGLAWLLNDIAKMIDPPANKDGAA